MGKGKVVIGLVAVLAGVERRVLVELAARDGPGDQRARGAPVVEEARSRASGLYFG